MKMTIRAPDPALEARAYRELVQAVALTRCTGIVAGRLVIQAKLALEDEDADLAHRLEDLAHELMSAARRADRMKPAAVDMGLPSFGPVDFFDVLQSMGSEVEK